MYVCMYVALLRGMVQAEESGFGYFPSQLPNVLLLLHASQVRVDYIISDWRWHLATWNTVAYRGQLDAEREDGFHSYFACLSRPRHRPVVANPAAYS